MKDMKDIRNASDRDLETTINEQREVLRQERFKDKMSRKASVITGAKKTVARAMTELTARRRNPENTAK